MAYHPPGVGKSALLDYVGARAAGCRLLDAAGVESEMELAYAGLHQLCAPVLDRIDGLPGPQRDALHTAFRLKAGQAPDRFRVGLAVLSLLAELAEEQPLVCLIDDAQWLDRISAQTLAFVARRLLAEPIAVVFAVREPADGKDLAGLEGRSRSSERRGCRGRPASRGDREARADAGPGGARPGTAALRRMAAERGAHDRGPRAPAVGVRPVLGHGGGGVRGSRSSCAAERR
jgi:hypothetical protein